MKVHFQIAECRFFFCKDNANERNESTFRLPSAAFSYLKIMQTSAMKVYFQIAECRLSSAKIMQIEDNTKE